MKRIKRNKTTSVILNSNNSENLESQKKHSSVKITASELARANSVKINDLKAISSQAIDRNSKSLSPETKEKLKSVLHSFVESLVNKGLETAKSTLINELNDIKDLGKQQITDFAKSINARTLNNNETLNKALSILTTPTKNTKEQTENKETVTSNTAAISDKDKAINLLSTIDDNPETILSAQEEQFKSSSDLETEIKNTKVEDLLKKSLIGVCKKYTEKAGYNLLPDPAGKENDYIKEIKLFLLAISNLIKLQKSYKKNEKHHNSRSLDLLDGINPLQLYKLVEQLLTDPKLKDKPLEEIKKTDWYNKFIKLASKCLKLIKNFYGNMKQGIKSKDLKSKKARGLKALFERKNPLLYEEHLFTLIRTNLYNTLNNIVNGKGADLSVN